MQQLAENQNLFEEKLRKYLVSFVDNDLWGDWEQEGLLVLFRVGKDWHHGRNSGLGRQSH